MRGCGLVVRLKGQTSPSPSLLFSIFSYFVRIQTTKDKLLTFVINYSRPPKLGWILPPF